ncbi:hypothetical protein OEZ86_007231 [Tetradesmus obliquus]|nr:hypothetical protein OEZ86_007231 [Tetradesmus obliquus]
MDVEKCKKVGKDIGGKIGKDACATTKCQNIAYGMCQQHAKEEAMKPSNGCKAAFMRFRRCNKDEWAGFWYPEVNELCAKAVKARINY